MVLQVLRYFDEPVEGLYKNDYHQLSLKRPPLMQEKLSHKEGVAWKKNQNNKQKTACIH